MKREKQSSLNLFLGIESQIKEDWDFNKEKTRYLTFGLHDYPARMIPQIPERLIERYLLKPFGHSFKHVLLDPFSGSGSVLTQGRLMRINVLGTDINPLAVLISRVQATPVNIDLIKSNLKIFDQTMRETYNFSATKRERDYIKVEFPNITHWFKNKVISDLSYLKNKIEIHRDSYIFDILTYIFSILQFKVSNIDKGSSRYIRILKEEQLKKHNPDVFGEFWRIKEKVFRRIMDFSMKCDMRNTTEVYSADARNLEIPSNTIDLIITSPPYGEQKNTLDYTRWSKLSLYWLGYSQKKILHASKYALGNEKSDSLDCPSKIAQKVINEVSNTKKVRALESVTFYHDYFDSLREMVRIIKQKHYICIIIGNRSINQIPIDMNKLTIELASKIGLKHVKTYFRGIPNKLIAPTGSTGKTISKENVIIFKKVN